MSQLLSNRYLLEEKIGSGGMAFIYRARDLQTKQTVAIKVLREEYTKDTEFVSRFDREAKAMQRVRHNNIVEVYAVGNDYGIPYIVMEYIDGPTLKDILRMRGKLPVRQCIQIMLNLCEAIQTAHDNGVIHRDLKPHNILVTPEGEVKITDFGIAKFVGSSTMTMESDNVLGSVHYIAPEQASGGETDEKTDVYSLGIAMYEMLTGRLPFEGDTTVSVAIKHIQESVPSPQSKNPEISHSLSACVMKACAKDPNVRYQTPGDFARDLVRAMNDPDGTFADLPRDTQEMPYQAPPARRRNDRSAESNRKTKKSIHKILWALLGCIVVLVTLFMIGRAIWQSSNDDMIAMPDLRGKTSAEAQSALSDLGLSISFSYQINDDVPEDVVYGQSISPQTMVNPKTLVTIYVSDGPEKISVPLVQGMTLDEANRRLSEAGLTPGIINYQFSATEADGTVIRQIPAADELVAKESEVNLVIASSTAPSTPQPGV